MTTTTTTYHDVRTGLDVRRLTLVLSYFTGRPPSTTFTPTNTTTTVHTFYDYYGLYTYCDNGLFDYFYFLWHHAPCVLTLHLLRSCRTLHFLHGFTTDDTDDDFFTTTPRHDDVGHTRLDTRLFSPTLHTFCYHTGLHTTTPTLLGTTTTTLPTYTRLTPQDTFTHFWDTFLHGHTHNTTHT